MKVLNQKKLREKFIKLGVKMIGPETIFFSKDTKIGNNVTIEPYVVIGSKVKIGNNVIIKSFSHLESCKVENKVEIGPYARIRPETILKEGSKVGNFVEIKKSTLGNKSKVNHLSYVGDAQIGRSVNIGAGTITCNYDGVNKNKTLIKDLNMIDSLCGELIDQAYSENRDVIVVSEYGITPVTDAIHINRALRAHGLLSVRNEMERDVFDPGASRAFAVSDHQLAHIYIKNKKDFKKVKEIILNLEGVETVLDSKDKSKYGLDHHRSGELIAISNADRWFSYYYWLDDKRAPDYAKTVDIHRKPGYDPVELFFDPDLKFPKIISF